jgi:hypothetical protein
VTPEGARVARSASADDDVGRGAIALLSAAVVVVLVLTAGWVLLRREGIGPFGTRRDVVTLGISLVPDATGTVVEVVGETSDGSLPATLDLDLRPADDVALVQGGPATGQRLRYSDVRDGLGNMLPPEQVRSGHLTGVGTDGRRVRLTFHVAAIGGHRIVYPIPTSPQLGWVRARLYVTAGTVTCWGDAPSGNSAFGPCESPQASEIDGTRHATVRLELEAPTAVSS